MRHVLQFLSFLLSVCCLLTAGADWPQFRGPTGLGYTDDTGLPITWGGTQQENVRWRSPLVGEGHASPIIWHDRVFVCTARWPEAVVEREKVIPEQHVLCYRLHDGQLLWDTLVPPGPWLRTDFRSGPGGGYACPTPATDGQRVYVAFGSSVIAALAFDGRLVWRKEIQPPAFDVTLGTSPILYGETVLLACAMADAAQSRIIAYDQRSGATGWEQKLPGTGFGHSTPVLIDVGARRQLLFCAGRMSAGDQALQSFDPATGRRLWWCWGGGETASPAYGGGLVYFDSGRGGPGVVVDPTGSGDVSASHVKWKVSQVSSALSSPIIVEGRVYRLLGNGVLKCWTLATGDAVYAERLNGLSTTWASPVADPRGVLFFANAGTSYVIQAGPECKVLAVNELGDGNHCSPAVADGRLVLVGRQAVYCVGKE